MSRAFTWEEALETDMRETYTHCPAKYNAERYETSNAHYNWHQNRDEEACRLAKMQQAKYMHIRRHGSLEGYVYYDMPTKPLLGQRLSERHDCDNDISSTDYGHYGWHIIRGTAPCERAYKAWREYYENNCEELNEYNRQYYADNRESIIERVKLYNRSLGKSKLKLEDIIEYV